MTTNLQGLSLRAITVILFFCWYLPSFGQDSTVLNSNKKTVVRYFDEVINTQNLNRMGEFFVPDYIWHQMNGTDLRRSHDSSHVSNLKWLFAAIPDLHYTIYNVVAEGDMVALNTTVTGTARTEMFGLSSAQKKVRFRQMFFFRLVNSKITDEWEVVDVDGMKAQLAKQ